MKPSCVAAPEGALAAAGGGVTPGGAPRLADATCTSRCVAALKATPGATVRLVGSHLDSAAGVIFKGPEGSLRSPVLKRLDDKPAGLTGRYLNQSFETEAHTITFDEVTLLRAAAKYGKAVAHVAEGKPRTSLVL